MSIYLWQQLAQAPITNPVLNTSVQNLTGNQFFAKLLPALITLGFVVGATVFVFMLIMGAISWITSGGDKAQVEAARSRVTNAVVGIFILLSIFAIINLIELFFNIDITTIDLGRLRIY